MPQRVLIRSSHVLRAAALAAAFCAPLQARAQAAITPGAVLDTVPDRKPALPPTPAEVIFPASRPDAVHDPSAPRFTVNAFTFVGNTVYTERQLKQLTERFIDLQLNLYDLNRAADTVTRLYRETGFPISRAIIPAQKVENGIVRIEVIEGRLANISIVGNDRYSSEFISIFAGSLPKNELVTVPRLERSLLLMNDLPGLSARATLAPGADYGTTDMVIRTEEKPFAATISLDNHGRRETGETRLDIGFDINNPLGLGDQLSARIIETRHNLLSFGRVAYSVPLTSEGTRFGTTHSRVRYDIGGEFAVLGISGEVTNTELLLTHPYVRSRARNLVFGIGLRSTTSTQTTLGIQNQNSRIDLLNLSVLGSWVHADSATTSATLVLSGNGKDNPGNRQNAQRAKADIDVSHLRAASKNWDLYLRGNWVLSSGALPDTEKFSLGGPGSVRGYRPSDLRGETGWVATGELRRQFVAVNTVGMFNMFYDWGAIKADGFTRYDTLRSAGFGVSVFPHKHLRAKVEYAHPLSDRISGDSKRGRLWFTLTSSF
ncbi:MAG: ShlB/FhaC/HecB family hemolysin secretion/activation protein [Burkholderiales bacterium]|nr:ShlB/FhaC/HecB family hemolysin secretion/activation protein [Burkholderiales bacterium]